jgi:hypothetical protein
MVTTVRGTDFMDSGNTHGRLTYGTTDVGIEQLNRASIATPLSAW